MGQGGQPLGSPGDLARQALQPGGDLLLVLHALPDAAEASHPVQGFGAHIPEGDYLGPVVQGYFGASATLQQPGSSPVEVVGKLVSRLHGPREHLPLAYLW